MEMRMFRNWLCYQEFLSDRERNALAERYADFSELLADGEKAWRDMLGEKADSFGERASRLAKDKKALSDAKNLYERQLEQGIFFCHLQEAVFPERLKQIPDPPLGLYYKGRLPQEQKTVAIIGARDCTPYGQTVAAELGKRLGEQGIPVISGMARGIDGIAQTAAMDAGGASYGVLGCGVDMCYPKSNRPLYDRLPGNGGVLSAYRPGCMPVAWQFPPRNRIVSGLADVVVVVEAGIKSGTLITVDMALEQGKEVWLVPGRITDRLSAGCNRLLSQGAEILWDIPEFLNAVTKGEAQPRQTDRSAGVTGEKRIVYDALDDTPRSVDDIEASLGARCALPQLNVLLMRLVLEGLATQPSPGYFCRK